MNTSHHWRADVFPHSIVDLRIENMVTFVKLYSISYNYTQLNFLAPAKNSRPDNWIGAKTQIPLFVRNQIEAYYMVDFAIFTQPSTILRRECAV